MHLNGYIDDEAWFGDEITPEALHGMLYPEGGEAHGDLRIFLNSYGGSCNAAVRMFDDLRAYPGNVHIIVSGTAASAATVLAMTLGSWIIHREPGVISSRSAAMASTVAAEAAVPETIMWTLPG